MKASMWKRDYRLDQMDLKELTRAYLLYPDIQIYFILGAISTYVAYVLGTNILPLIAAAAAMVVIYPLFWYVLHRFVLHGKYLYKSKYTSSLWKRIHFDHHRDPHDLQVLFGALHTTLPTLALVSMPLGYVIAGYAGAAAGFASSIFTTCFYEYIHCIQHLNFQPRSKILQRVKRLHLQHHFHDETANYGITNFVPDRLFGTHKPSVKGRPRSETVFNLGYTKDEVSKYPWVAQFTHDLDVETASREGIDRRKPTRDTTSNKAA